MGCLKDELIQKYIDGETTEEEVIMIKEHLAVCGECSAKVRHQQCLAAGIKKKINSLTPKTVEIPAVVSFSDQTRKQMFPLKKLVYIVAAACILLFVLFITRKKDLNNRDDVIFTQYYDWDNYNANRTISQQPIVINFYDKKGNVKKYIIE